MFGINIALNMATEANITRAKITTGVQDKLTDKEQLSPTNIP